MSKKVLITGSSGFIGFHLAGLLLKNGYDILGIDAMTKYYDVNLKIQRRKILQKNKKFRQMEFNIQDKKKVLSLAKIYQPDIIIHLAAQAGVRYSLKNPQAYIDTNIVGTFNIMELAQKLSVEHLLMASTSSVYGANDEIPFHEKQNTDTPLTIYAATKKANEAMAHSYSYLHSIPTTMFRFFTVYGPWGRPDMALFKFTKGILNGEAIDIYNHGDMYRDFTYVDDLVESIKRLIFSKPVIAKSTKAIEHDSISSIAPFRIVNIGNSQKVRLLDFVNAIEKELGVLAKRNFMDLQPGDVPATWADSTLLRNLIDFQPDTNIQDGVSKFVTWYREYYGI